MIKNKKTGQMYIGQSKNIEQRFKLHCRITDIDKAIMLEGKDNFDFIILEETSKDELLKREEYWINYYNTANNPAHYNQIVGNILKNRRKYTLWNVSCCNYDRRKSNKMFAYRYNHCVVPIGLFHDFVSCEIINQLVKEAIKER